MKHILIETGETSKIGYWTEKLRTDDGTFCDDESTKTRFAQIYCLVKPVIEFKINKE